MTGTSLDALDVSLIQATGHGLALHATVAAHATHDLGELRPRLRAASEGAPLCARDFAALALDFGNLHARALRALAGSHQIHLAAIHGQTIFHAPPLSWQLVNPWPVAQQLRCPVVCDLRGADLALGGQGAPITPLADWILFRGDRATVVVNLGGFCNITWMPAAKEGPDAIGGADICPCNHLLDAAARTALGQPFDRDGNTALRGTANPTATKTLRQWLETCAQAGRSLGTGDEGVAWISRHAATLQPADLLATVAAAIGAHIGAIAARRCPNASRIILAGGGARNAALCAAIAHAAHGAQVIESSTLGIAFEARESAEMAVLGLLAFDGVPITLAGVTGKKIQGARDGLWCLPQ